MASKSKPLEILYRPNYRMLYIGLLASALGPKGAFAHDYQYHNVKVQYGEEAAQSFNADYSYKKSPDPLEVHLNRNSGGGGLLEIRVDTKDVRGFSSEYPGSLRVDLTLRDLDLNIRFQLPAPSPLVWDKNHPTGNPVQVSVKDIFVRPKGVKDEIRLDQYLTLTDWVSSYQEAVNGHLPLPVPPTGITNVQSKEVLREADFVRFLNAHHPGLTLVVPGK